MCAIVREYGINQKTRRYNMGVIEETCKKRRAAAYCRVSTKRDLQDGSFETQCEYYQKKIGKDPQLELVGIYGDHGKSGRAIKGRPEFKRLLKYAGMHRNNP
jgi:hypothetical protein